MIKRGSEIGGVCSTYWGRGKRNAWRVLGGELKERDYMGDFDIDGRILNWIDKKQDGSVWTGLLWLRIGTGGGLL